MPDPEGAVLLDLYDTVAWTDWPALRDLMCERLGLDSATLLRAFDLTRPARSIGTYEDAAGDIAAVLDALGIDEPGLAAELADTERTFLLDGVHVYDDALPTVRELRARGHRTALISNCSHSTRPTVDRLGLEDEFDAVVLSFEVGASKPSPDIYRAALRALDDAEPDAAVFVDDQARYCDGARELGIQTRLIVRGRVPDPIEGASAASNGHMVITDLRALLD
jgi:putative hydrolase of the HAD superfamily